MRKVFHTIVTITAANVLMLAGVAGQESLLADHAATRETINVYKNLKRISQHAFLFGHQDDLAYGVEWRFEPGRSDVKDVTGDYPGIYGWELGGLESGQLQNLDGVPFDRMRQFIEEGYQRGAAITISWHAGSPLLAPKGAWDTTHGTVASILPSGHKHGLYTEWLDKIGSFIESLKGSSGESIPVFFRPFHELTGNWFWWGRSSCSPEEYKALWRFTFDYLTNRKGLHNIIWVYNTGGDFRTEQEFLERYPGDDVVDVLSFDAYQFGDPQADTMFQSLVRQGLHTIGELAAARNKLFALAETGYEAIPYSSWWTRTLLKAIGDNRIAWVLVWRNHGLQPATGKMHYYAPYRGQVSAKDFIRFYKNKRTLFETDARKEKLYR